jgi:hypothetical protein
VAQLFSLGIFRVWHEDTTSEIASTARSNSDIISSTLDSTSHPMPTVIRAASRRCLTAGRFRRVSRWCGTRTLRRRLRLISRRASAVGLSEPVRVPDVRIVGNHYRQTEPQILLSDKPKAPRRAGVGSVAGRACIASLSRIRLSMIFGSSQMPNNSPEPPPIAFSVPLSRLTRWAARLSSGR